MRKYIFICTLISYIIMGNFAIAQSPSPTSGVVDEVVWIVGDEAILLSDVEANIGPCKVRDNVSTVIPTA